MTLPEFEDLIGRHGGDARRWPTNLQPDAYALLQSSVVARKALSSIREVEQLLAASQVRPADREALAARASSGPQVRPINRLVLKTGWSAAAAALLAIGILVGRTSGINPDDDPSLALSRALASTETFNVE
jgi:hypothetical protein